ncbi:type II and III secretion system protein family protein [Vibrio tapetis subsp. quintayensis]|uniref:type II and III secretion system protein family protein n=1 Tax=Vibrio tapetis TaxID=52443 RepID=UPI0025B5BBD1|nr:type II and III secretion system protein family protein [Vibrio tapetis]MDN3680456.1 type II and III secretion system protein family protein [Vibrio tapetis subsp. quintayensis]
MKQHVVSQTFRIWLTGFALSFFVVMPVFQANAAQISSAKQTLNLYLGSAKVITLQQAANTVFIADPSIASFQASSDKTLIVFGRKPGSSSLFVLDENGHQVYSANVRVGYDLSGLRPTLKREFPLANIGVRAYGGGVMLSGSVPDAATAAQALAITNEFVQQALQIGSEASTMPTSDGGESAAVGRGAGIGGYKQGLVLNRLKINAPTQVNIRIRIAEVSKQVKENFGFQWNYLNKSFSSGYKKIAIADNPIISENLFKGSKVNPLRPIEDIVGMVDILAEENLVTVLAEPNLTATTGETASFLAGGEVPQVISGGKDGAATIEYRPFGVLLAVTPTIMSNNRIALKVKTEISDLSSANSVVTDGIVQQGFDIRRAETSVELASGQSFALAGLIKRRVNDDLQNLPWVNQIPVLGRLFESSQFKNSESELVIIASAHLVEPTRVPLALPTDNLHLSSPFERLIFGRSLKPIDAYQKPPQAIASEAFKGFEF